MVDCCVWVIVLSVFWSKVSVFFVFRMWLENILKYCLMGESMLFFLVFWVVYFGESFYFLSLSNWLGIYFICYIKIIVLIYKWWCVGFKLIYRESEYVVWMFVNGYVLNYVIIFVYWFKFYLNKIKKFN